MERNQSGVIIACSMLEDEVSLAMRTTGCTLPVVWLERGLHESPGKLRSELSAAIGEQKDAGTILLAYTLCGNAIAGVGSAVSRLVVPRFDDCIHMSLAVRRGAPPAVDAHTLYYTRGWLLDDRSLGASFRSAGEKYGTEKARCIYRQILRNYRQIVLLDTGAYPLSEIRDELRSLAKEFKLSFGIRAGSVRILEKLFSGVWDEEFCIAEPGSHFRQEQFVSG